MRVSLLGDFVLSVDDQPVEVMHATERMIAYLALTNARRSTRERIGAELWPDQTSERTLANVRSTLWRVPPTVRSAIDTTATTVTLASEVAIDVDLLYSTDAVDVGVVDAISSSLLPGWYDDWLVPERERVEIRRIVVLEQIAHAHLAERRFAEAIDVALIAIAAEPFRESLHRLVMQSHIDEGNYSEAVAHFDRMSLLFATELGLEPSATTARLVPVGHMTAARRAPGTMARREA